MEINVDKLTPLQALESMKNTVLVSNDDDKNLPFFLHGSPGIGKSDMVEQLAKFLNMKLEVEMLTQIEVADLRGLLFIDDENNTTVNYRPEWLPGIDDPPTLIFLDELPAAEPRIQVVGYQLLLAGKIGRYELGPQHYVCGAGNKIEDGAIVYEMGTALSGRLLHFSIEPDVRSWLQWAAGANIHPTVMTYIQLHPHMLENLQEQLNASHLIGPDPRRWERVSRVLTTLGTDREKVEPLVQGLIGKSTAHDFFLTMKEMEGLPTPKAILDLNEEAFIELIPDNEANMWGIGYSMIAFADTPERMCKATKFFGLMLENSPETVTTGDIRSLCMEILLQKSHDMGNYTDIMENEHVGAYLDEEDQMIAIQNT